MAEQYQDNRIALATASILRLADAMKVAEQEAIAADPGLIPHLERARKIDPDIGWLDIAAFRENRTRSAPRAVRVPAEDPRAQLATEAQKFFADERRRKEEAE